MIGDINKALKDFQSGNETVFTELYEQYKPLMLSMINRIILSSFPGEGGSEHDVFMQEATMALYNAAKSFDVDQSEVTFGLYSKICIKNKLISVKRKLVSAQKKKNKADNARSRLASEKDSSLHKRKIELVPGQLADVIENNLSEFEKKVFDLYLEDLSYAEIAESINVSLKAVDNAVYRIRCKLKKHI